ECLGEPANRRERRLELVRRVGDEVAPHRLEAPELGDVEQRRHGPAPIETPGRQEEVAVHDLDLTGTRHGAPERGLERRTELGVAHDGPERWPPARLGNT